ncbi:MAG TPA: hypothetical protein DCQ98_04355 [Planctomycetaceae bacterium]|nr:hypothetical protein [Planctomycetaceae bacterium]HRF01426.1 hypothetical protein [Pirellulaceae bacterium]
MTCVHLQQLFQLCKENDLKIASSDLIRVVCRQCDEQEVCPSVLSEEYDALVERSTTSEATPAPTESKP